MVAGAAAAWWSGSAAAVAVAAAAWWRRGGGGTVAVAAWWRELGGGIGKGVVREERKFPSSPATAKITKVGLQLHFGWAHAHPGDCLSNLKILARYLKFHF